MDDDFSPKTIEEAIERFMSCDFTESDEDVIMNTPLERIEWLHSNFEPTIMAVTDLNKGNTALLEACGNKDMSPHDASLVIMKHIWHYWRTGEINMKME
jgi:hypothetical protein